MLLERLRTLLILGRVSNLPTVWSNICVGWGLTGVYADDATQDWTLPVALLAGSLLYIGGMYLNDFCDAKFDAQYCPQRPIPAGQISRRAVGLLALLWFVLGIACVIPFGVVPVVIALILVAFIALYDFHHKGVRWAPCVMGFCRFLLYPFAYSVVYGGNLIFSCLIGIPIAIYVAGITYVARGESRPDRPAHASLVLVLYPVMGYLFLSYFDATYITATWFFSLLLLCWMAWLFVPLWRKMNRSIGRVVAGLLAGIVLVDAIAASRVVGWEAGWLLPLFILALLLQRVIPAT